MRQTAIVFVLGSLLSLAGHAQVFFYPVGPAPRSVSTSASASVQVEAASVSLTVEIREQAMSASEAGSQHATSMAGVVSALESIGLAGDRLPQSSYSISRNENYDTGELISYEASSSLTLELTDPDRLGKVVDTLLAAGASEISGIQFLAADPEQARRTALRQAFEAAKSEAQDLAAWSGATLGPVTWMSSDKSSGRRISTGSTVTRLTTTTFIPVPQVEISANVSVRWELVAKSEE